MDPTVIKTTSISKFDINGRSLYVKVIWKFDDHDLFHIKIFDSDVTWSGTFSKESAKKFRERSEETETQYNKHVMKYVKGAVSNECTYDFVIEDADLAVFTWKKRYEETLGPVFLVHGSVRLHRDENVTSKDVLLDFLFEENTELRTAIDKLNEQNEIVSLELQKCKGELKKFVDIKSSLESSLYGKFVQLLNAKKRRIQILESNLHKFSDELGGDH